MSVMSHKQGSNLNIAIVISIVLHVGLIAMLGYSALKYSDPNAGDLGGEAVSAIMVDPSVMTEQYQRQLQHQLDQQKAEQQRQQQIEKQASDLQEKQIAEQQRLKELEKERLLAQERQKQEADAALIAKQKTDEEIKKAKEELAEQTKQAELVKQKAQQEAEKQKQAEQAAKQKAAEEAKEQQALNDILGGLTSNTPKSQRGVSSGELDKYKSMVNNAISNKFMNPKLYSGQSCELVIKLAPDGLLLSVTSKNGDTALCREAISATKLAVFPKPSSNQLYQQVKDLTIDFRPQ